MSQIQGGDGGGAGGDGEEGGGDGDDLDVEPRSDPGLSE